MLTTDDPPPTKSKWSTQELDKAFVQFELTYENLLGPATGTGTLFIKRDCGDGTVLMYVEVLQINWHTGENSLHRFPLDQERVDQIVRLPASGQNQSIFRLLT